jgi:two-component system response regulator YesN
MPKILVVDDSSTMCVSIKKMLEEKNMEVIEAENGKEALKIIANTNDIYLVLTDVIMPEVDGLELTRILTDKYPHIPVVVMSAATELPYLKIAEKLGAVEWLIKPFSKEQLNGIVAKVFSDV